jgi:glycosyltransferase involved in cell wall biosynthesis
MQNENGLTTMIHESPFISIIIPAYNEAVGIGSLLDSLKNLEFKSEIIVVDDGSSDETPSVVQERNWVRLIRHPYNLGNGAAWKSGIRTAQGEYIVILDADGQHNPMDLPRLVDRLTEGGYDMVVGARQLRPDNEKHRDLANTVFQAFAGYMADHKIPDLTSGFRVFRADLAKSFVGLLPKGFSSPSTMTMAFLRSGHTVFYEPIDLQKRKTRSKIKLLRDGLRFLFIILRIGLFFAPMRIFLPLTLAFFFTGLGYGTYLLIAMHRFSNMAMLFILLGILFFILGLISEQISLLRLMLSERLRK